VSLKLTAICIVDQTGRIEREGVVASNLEAIAAFIKSHAPHVARIGLETGATSTWLWTELNKMGLHPDPSSVARPPATLATRTLRNASIVAFIAPGSANVARASYAPTTIKTTGRQLTVAVN
jgi:hypothetical protein